MKGIEYLILRVGLVFILWLVTMPVAAVSIALMDHIGNSENYRDFKWLLLPIPLAWIFGVPWFANKTAEYMAFQGFEFREASNAAFSDLRLRLAFLPVIGHWFAPKHDDTDDDHDA